MAERAEVERPAESAGGGVRRGGGEPLAGTAYRLLKRRIVNNELPPSGFIDERQVAQELGMSRTPVREALLLLQNEELVEVAARRGIRVVPSSLAAMAEV